MHRLCGFAGRTVGVRTRYVCGVVANNLHTSVLSQPVMFSCLSPCSSAYRLCGVQPFSTTAIHSTGVSSQLNSPPPSEKQRKCSKRLIFRPRPIFRPRFRVSLIIHHTHTYIDAMGGGCGNCGCHSTPTPEQEAELQAERDRCVV